jgi:hypothetical protein
MSSFLPAHARAAVGPARRSHRSRREGGRLALALVLVLAALHGRADAAAPAFGESQWRQWTFDRLGDLGDEAALALDYRNYPLALYYDCSTTPKTLIFARFEGQAWTREAVTPVDAPCGGLFPGLAVQVGPDDQVQAAYFESRGPGASDDRLRYARRNAAASGKSPTSSRAVVAASVFRRATAPPRSRSRIAKASA